MTKVLRIWVLIVFAFMPACSLADTFVAHCRNFPPEIFFDGRVCIGVVPELTTDILKELGHDIEWVYAPWIRSMKEAKRGNVDLLVRHSMTPKRSEYLVPIKYASKESYYFLNHPNFLEI